LHEGPFDRIEPALEGLVRDGANAFVVAADPFLSSSKVGLLPGEKGTVASLYPDGTLSTVVPAPAFTFSCAEAVRLVEM